MIIRCVESLGIQSDVKLNLSFANTEWKGSFKPSEIKTLRLEKGTNKITEVNLLEA